MKLGSFLALAALWFAGAPALAQNGAWQFRWHKGQTLTYKVEQKTNVSEVADGMKVVSASKLNLVKRWQVADIDASGVATLHLVLTAMRNEQTRPDGEVLLFDSANPGKSTPELKEQMSKYVGQTLAVLRVDRHGRVVEVKQGAAARYDAEPPFAVVFPDAALAEGKTWLRTFHVTLEPPLGAGEKHEATQKYHCVKTEGAKATITVATQWKALPENAKEQIPLLQKMPEGLLVFDVTAGRLLHVQLTTDRTVQNHAGEGSSYRFQSSYVEQLVE
ncbi:MAG: hypothetical protein L0Y72_01945 [Gemmataceae bacterium]|nr:hypothetical protein [Gemmataceae bacterium]MCI0638984.1 hypothetical protein [Gemmataceae bacterium]MCI0737778.1 hypothetical protein [Gemmataceae bacterium]